MPSVVINAGNIGTFNWKATFDIYQRKITFDISGSTYQGGGAAAVPGVAFSVQDQDGVDLALINWTAPQIPGPVSTNIWVLDLSNVNYAFLFQNYKITGAIQDASGTIYQTPAIYKKVCQPVGITQSGYVPGIFRLTPNCPANTLTVNENTLLVYNQMKALSVSKSGTLNYPTGTIAPVNFTGTPLNNNQVYTGAYQIRCTTVGTYYFQDDFYIVVTYITAAPFNITCATKMADLLCCIERVQDTYLKNCDNARGQNAKQLLDQIDIPLTLGFAKETNGQDSSEEAEYIRKVLNCDCGINSLQQNEISPVNTSLNSIVIVGINGTNVTPGQNGNTVTYTVDSSIYQIAKGDAGDLSYSIAVDNSVEGTTKYLITFNPVQQAVNILNAIALNPSTLQVQLNSLINVTGAVSVAGLVGKCVIDLTKADYTVIQQVTNVMLVQSIVINGTTYAAPTNLSATDVTGIAAWLNGLTLGTFSVSFNSLVLLIQSLSNPNTLSTITFSNPAVTVRFSSTNATLVQVLQAIIDYICGMTSLQIALGANLTLCQFDYSGNVVMMNYIGTGSTPASQADYNTGLAQAICNLVTRINALTGLTCAAIKSLFPDNPGVAFGPSDRIYGTLNGGCAGLTDLQLGNLFIAAVNKYPDLKNAFCNIDCTIPGSCPDISGISAGPVTGGIGIYGVTFNSPTTAVQTASVKYKLPSDSTFITATSNLLINPNGTISGTTPFVIPGLTAGQTYQVFVANNCGGNGFTILVTVPTGSVVSGTFRLDNVAYNICGDSTLVLYSSVAFGTGVTMYTDPGLTTPVTGFIFIANAGGNIYGINATTGVVGANTGSTCNSGTPGTYILGNNSSTVCSGVPATFYTNGIFATGLTLYNDSALTSPVTGFTFVVNASNNHIFNLNTSTGAIGSDTGTLCSSTATLTFRFVNAGGSFLNFQANLSRAIDGNVNISRVFADGFSNSGCTGGAVAAAQSNTTNSILSGSTGVGYNPDSTTGSWASATNYSMFNVIVNGASHVNGDTITVGSFTVTIVIPSCN